MGEKLGTTFVFQVLTALRDEEVLVMVEASVHFLPSAAKCWSAPYFKDIQDIRKLFTDLCGLYCKCIPYW